MVNFRGNFFKKIFCEIILACESLESKICSQKLSHAEFGLWITCGQIVENPALFHGLSTEFSTRKNPKNRCERLFFLSYPQIHRDYYYDYYVHIPFSVLLVWCSARARKLIRDTNRSPRCDLPLYRGASRSWDGRPFPFTSLCSRRPLPSACSVLFDLFVLHKTNTCSKAKILHIRHLTDAEKRAIIPPTNRETPVVPPRNSIGAAAGWRTNVLRGSQDQ